MTLIYALDLTKTLTENVTEMVKLASDEREFFKEILDVFTLTNVQQTLILTTNDWHLLHGTKNAFEVDGLTLLKKSHPKLHIELTGHLDKEKLKQDQYIWDNQPDHKLDRETHNAIMRNATKIRLERELGISIPPDGLPPNPTLPTKYKPSWFHKLFPNQN